jgi:murein DD-endopeptidase MepM/ murein hydrolase activator NlpD
MDGGSIVRGRRRMLAPNKTVLKPTGSPLDVNSYWGYGTPVLAVAPGVVTEVVNTFSDSVPTKNPNIGGEDAPGNHVILDIGNGRYVAYAHLQLNSIKVKVGQHVHVGQQIGNLGNTGNSYEPHLHFQLMNGPSFTVSHGLPFVFDKQLLEGRISEADSTNVDEGSSPHSNRANSLLSVR